MCRSSIVWFPMALAIASLVMCEESMSRNYETVHTSNAAILNRLGLVPVRLPEGHHKKRLAGPEPSSDVQLQSSSPDSHTRLHQPYSRRHGHRDSHVYIVKLPPSQPYYTLTKPHKSVAAKPSDESSGNNKMTAKLSAASKLASSSSPQVGFHSNGKPAKIYHWNLPIVEKIAEKKRLHSQMRFEQMRKKLELEMNDQEHGENNYGQVVEKPSSRLNKKPLALKSSMVSDFNGKRYHHSSSSNSLHHDEKPMKHVRNNDKRLNYPRISDELVNKVSEKAQKQLSRKAGSATSNKMYRLEDSNLYRLGSESTKDRLNAWKMANELHAPGNIAHGQNLKKHRKKAAMSYYAPINSSKSLPTSAASAGIQKNFPGNGKPKALYVMEKGRQPVYYHHLLP